ncbi:hypothetical protein CRV08_08270 [Halarcobacter ebronensis]|uniref:Ricin B lectin domain-containing protein n=1 Tax=Halarcobacter ebronensis TaxID=1462615 RepID=A0A4V1LRH7_9BACT|nr:RICIN domain-containing protein [Halarcobacter ebronensis]RXJ68238.1 hypothetical protein CRV08_08270 [Halarcobacter ebronensis]
MKKLLFLLSLFIMTLNILNASELIDGKYSIQSIQTGYCLDIEDMENNAKIIQLPCKEDKESQKFDFFKVDNKIYTISSLSIGNNSKSNGAHIYNTNEADEFLLEEQTNAEIYKIKSNFSKKYFTSKIFTNDVVQYNGHNTDAQLWRITKNPINDTDDSLLKVKKIVFSDFVEPKMFNWLSWKFYRADETYIPMDDISQIESISGMTIRYNNDIAGYSSHNYVNYETNMDKCNRRDGNITIVLLQPEDIKYLQVRSTYWIPNALTEEFKLSLYNSNDELLYSHTYTKLGDGIGDAASNNGRIYGYNTQNPLPDIVLERP